jgi:hypothetical protein
LKPSCANKKKTTCLWIHIIWRRAVAS